ncbi:MAG: alpha/beta hydrolase [Verrucomicrobiales bacterium VVV1]|nr:MAG: alpha/beta hydrolase [Verrucomicrobiales bacterium VVV1]
MKRVGKVSGWMAGLMASLLSSCLWIPQKPVTPVRTLSDEPPEKPKQLVVMLPGRWSKPEEFQRELLMEMARKHWPQARIVAPNLHLGYYTNRVAVERLHEDVILPAEREGVKEIIVVGVSMGGLGALIYDLEHPGKIDRMILLSPFVGDEEAIREIDAAGGVRSWKPGVIEEKDFSRKLWVGLKQEWLGQRKRPEIVLACGDKDRLRASNERFSKDFLKPNEVISLPGDHDWPTWRTAFGKILGGGSNRLR